MSTAEVIQVEEIIEEEEVIQEEVNEDAPVIMKITSSGIKAEFEGPNGNKVFKNIGLGSLSRVLNRDSEFDTGFLPLYGRNYIGIKRYIKMGDKEILFIESCPSNRNVRFGGRSDTEMLEGVRFPGLVMGVVCRVKNNGDLEIRDTKLYATKGPLLRDTDQLYTFPFGNVYEDGRICWGQVDFKKGIKNLTGAGSLLNEFLSHNMNTDLYRGGGNLKSKLNGLKDGTEYPYDTLRSADLSFRDLTSLLKGKNVG